MDASVSSLLSEVREDEMIALTGRRVKRNLRMCLIIVIVLGMISMPHERAAARAQGVTTSFQAPPGVFSIGEELIYEVSYSVFSLGTVKLQILDTMSKDGVTLYQTKAFMDSYSSVPFVDLHYVFYSEIDPDFFSHYFSGLDTKNPNATTYADYSFNYADKTVTYAKGVRQHDTNPKRGKDTISTVYQDGLSLFYYARGSVHSTRRTDVPTFVNEKKGNTYINFMNKKSSTEIDAVTYPVETVEIEGRAEFVGIFGLTGGFSGWFSNDDAAVPILAKMKVILGSVRVELIKWNRPGWTPPRAAQ